MTVVIGTAFAGAVTCTASFQRLMRVVPAPRLPDTTAFSSNGNGVPLAGA